MAFSPWEDEVSWPMLTKLALDIIVSKDLTVWFKIPRNILELVDVADGPEYVLPAGARRLLQSHLSSCRVVVVEPSPGFELVVDESP